MRRAAPRLILFERSISYLRYIGGARLLTGYGSSHRKCRNVVRIDRSAWMVYIGTSGYINHRCSMVDGFLRLKIVMTLDEGNKEKEREREREKVKDYVCDR